MGFINRSDSVKLRKRLDIEIVSPIPNHMRYFIPSIKGYDKNKVRIN